MASIDSDSVMPPFQVEDSLTGQYQSFIYPRFAPRYDKRADYNTNGVDYMDALANLFEFLDTELSPYVNSLIFRQVKTKDTDSIELNRDGDWYKKDRDEVLSANVRLSQLSKEYQNAISILNDGLYAKDFTNEIAGIHDTISANDKAINQKVDLQKADLTDLITNIQRDLTAKIAYQQNVLQCEIDSDNERLRQIELSINQYVNGGYKLVITHNLNRQPTIQAETYDWAIGTETDGFGNTPNDSFGEVNVQTVSPKVEYLDSNNVQLSFPLDQQMRGSIFNHDNAWYVVDGTKTLKVTLI